MKNPGKGRKKPNWRKEYWYDLTNFFKLSILLYYNIIGLGTTRKNEKRV